MSTAPSHLQYTKEHEWVEKSSPTSFKMGITDYAQSALGDIVYVQLPKVGESISEGSVCGEVESTKSVSEIYSPVTGKVIEVNTALSANPELINSDPYGAGWLAIIEISSEPQALLSSQEYLQITS